jgi:lantibiotic modifying enzyme
MIINKRIDLIKQCLSQSEFLKEDESGTKMSIYSGDIGKILFFLYMKDYNMVESLLYNLFNYFDKNKNHINNSFSSGVSGFSWFLNSLLEDQILDEKNVGDLLIQTDEVSFHSAMNNIKNKNHDFLHGAVGQASYLSDRINKNNKVSNYLNSILNGLKNISQQDNKGVYWMENTFYSELLKDQGKAIVNLSLSHGLASKIILFSKLYKKGFSPNLTRELLEGSVRFLLGCKNKKSDVSVFPSRIDETNSQSFSRLSWCYGDLGISIALWQAGEALSDQNIKDEAENICLRTTIRKTLDLTGVLDAGLCHGSSGIAHIYNRMYGYTGNKIFKDTANFWIQETLNLATFKDGFAGYKAYYQEDLGGRKNKYGLLNGISGIGLSLISHTNEEDPKWDKFLLLS